MKPAHRPRRHRAIGNAHLGEIAAFDAASDGDGGDGDFQGRTRSEFAERASCAGRRQRNGDESEHLICTQIRCARAGDEILQGNAAGLNRAVRFRHQFTLGAERDQRHQ